MKCIICNKELHHMGGFHLAMHDITKEEYHSLVRKASISKLIALNRERKDRTYEEIYGERNAKEIRQKSSDAMNAVWKTNPGFNNRAKSSKTMKDKYISGEIVVWNKGLKGYGEGHEVSKETRQKIGSFNSVNMRKVWQDPEYREHSRKAHREAYTNDPDLLRRVLSCQKPNKSEKLLISLFAQHNLPYKYVGNGDFILGGKCPDFINVNGEKQIIELFGTYWHSIFDVAKRTEHFRQYGFDTLVIWEDELKNTDAVISKMKKFSRRKLIHAN